MMKKKPAVIIIGGGAAGLIAANDLSKKCAVTMLESQKELGGRIKTINIPGNRGIVEAGAEFIHGSFPITFSLIGEAGLKAVKVEGKMLRKEKNKWIEQDEMIEGWDDLLKKMKGLRTDMTMQDFILKYFAADKYTDLRRHMKSYTEGFDLADPEKVSIKSLYKEWSNEEEEQFRLKEGYGSIISLLANKAERAGCTIVTGDPVRQVDWQQNDVTVYTSSGRKYSAEKLLITVPVSVLGDIKGHCSINFTPPLDEYIHATREIGFGSAIKVVFDFKEKFWQKDLGFVFTDEMLPTWWTHNPIENNLLTGWAGGPVAEKLSLHTDDELIEIGLIALSHIFEKRVDDLRNILTGSYVFNWHLFDSSLGAYSYSTPGSKAARKILNTPLADTVFFAGEGLFDGDYPGTVEAAFRNGKMKAAELLKSLK
jgi:monoamine oxidase